MQRLELISVLIPLICADVAPSSGLTWHSSPDPDGSGFVQVLNLLWNPLPSLQAAQMVKFDHNDQLPARENKSLTLLLLLTVTKK
jgi:hypothetical protein